MNKFAFWLTFGRDINVLTGFWRISGMVKFAFWLTDLVLKLLNIFKERNDNL